MPYLPSVGDQENHSLSDAGSYSHLGEGSPDSTGQHLKAQMHTARIQPDLAPLRRDHMKLHNLG